MKIRLLQSNDLDGLLTGRKDRATLRLYESAGFDPNEKQGFIAKPAQAV